MNVGREGGKGWTTKVEGPRGPIYNSVLAHSSLDEVKNR